MEGNELQMLIGKDILPRAGKEWPPAEESSNPWEASTPPGWGYQANTGGFPSPSRETRARPKAATAPSLCGTVLFSVLTHKAGQKGEARWP